VIVPTYRRREAVIRLLGALDRQTAAPASFEVIVVVDGADDGTAEAVDASTTGLAVRVLWQENAGCAAARNRGIAAATGELLILLDDDMVPEPGLVAAHVGAHRDGRPRFAMGPAPLAIPAGAGPFLRYMATTRGEHYARLAEPGHVLHVRDLYSANASVPRAVLAAAGGFDEGFRTYGGEDVDLALRLREAGVELTFVDEARAAEAYEKTFRELAADMVEEGRNAVAVAIAHPQAAAGQQFAEPWPQPRAWKAARSTLLGMTRVLPATQRGVVALTDALDRRAAPRMHLWLRFVLEYHYWLGAGPALKHARAEGHELT
jgi:GT2 family glycosyltransferase